MQPKIKRLHFDLEVSPNIHFSWRAGGKIFLSHETILKERTIICACYKWEHQKKIHALTWDNGDDKQLVIDLCRVMNEADEVVAHYGDAFDVRWLKARCLIHDLPALPLYKSIDTYKIAKKHFYLNSYKLDYLGELLFKEGKIKTEYQLWKDICSNNDPKAMRKMVKYCKKDVELLQRVYEKLSAFDTPKSHIGVLTGLEKWTCPHCGSMDVYLSKTRVTPKGTKQRQMQCHDCHRYYTIANNVYRGYRRRGE